MSKFKFKSLTEAFRKIIQDHDSRENRVDRARVKAAKRGTQLVRRNAPMAFGGLDRSIHTSPDHTIVADAPHAAAVERGSRPHTPPLEPLIDWVKLRGMQGLTQQVSDVVAIARGIQRSIAMHGTKPHWYMRSAIPKVRKILGEEVRKALPDKGGKD